MNIELLRNQVIKDFSEHVSKYKAKYYKKLGVEIVMGKREGIYFWDISGKRYINCHCNGGVFNMGHKNPDILNTLLEASKDFDIGNHHLISGPRSMLARKLSASFQTNPRTAGEPITNVIFAVSGGEAVDLAIKMARGYTKKQKIVSLVGGYHGHTGLAMAAGDQKYKKPFATQLPDFHQIPFGSWEAMEASLSQDTAALIIETCPATLGMPIFPIEVMLQLRKKCTKNNVVLILDEIQTGLGRTGKTWAFQHYNILPDIVVTGKGLSGGIYPIAAVCFPKKYEKLFQKDPFIHISTFGGAELGCFATLKTLELITEPSFLENVNSIAKYFSEQFNTLIQENEEMVEFRQLGLFMAVVFQDSATCLTFIKTLMANGIYAVYANNDKKVMQFLPPLIITKKEAEEVVSIIKTTLIDLKKFKNRLLKKVISTFVIKD